MPAFGSMKPGRNMYAALKGRRRSAFSVRPFTRAQALRPCSELSVPDAIRRTQAATGGNLDQDADRVRMLESEGWVSRDYKPTVPPQVTYAITKKVLELDGVMIELDRIAERWYGKGRNS